MKKQLIRIIIGLMMHLFKKERAAAHKFSTKWRNSI
jgi:hypothetical protein